MDEKFIMVNDLFVDEGLFRVQKHVEHSGNTHKDKNTDNNVVRSVRISFL
jgi:hypothetical protein